MTQIGYARVSSIGQSLDVQLEKLKHCYKTYQEKKSATAKRENLEASWFSTRNDGLKYNYNEEMFA
jgi:DNA invertase Pin-like site-specific DNA recombinase